MNTTKQNQQFETQSISDFVEKSYITYAMHVILDRALPHISDGLKPVQRRIIYAMSEIGLLATNKHKKSARTVGDVLGKYHPHGDAACYEAMVLMAQNFSYRYPLVHGKGNWGSIDSPKSFAAMRYTESKLSNYAEILLSELKKGSISWVDNFDGTLKEPKLLPAMLPNILLNGASGIAVGMATEIPSHNITEIINGTLAVLENPYIDVNQIIKIIPAPDYAGGADIISSKADRIQIYLTGMGSIKQRAIYNINESSVIIKNLPYKISGSKLISAISDLMIAKKILWIDDIYDDSDEKNPSKIIIILKKNTKNTKRLMEHLCAITDLEKSHRVNLNMISLKDKPKVFSLIEIISQWIEYRKDILSKQFNHSLNKIAQRLHIINGLIIAFYNINEIIHIIRTEDDAKSILMNKYNLSEIQEDNISNLKLKSLAKIKEQDLNLEKKELQTEQKKLNELTTNQESLKKFIKNQLINLNEKFGDDRLCKITEKIDSKILKHEELIAPEDITLILSKENWVKSVKSHNSSIKNIKFKAGDEYFLSSKGKNTDTVLFFDGFGKSYTLPATSFDSKKIQGEPLNSKLNIDTNKSIKQIAMIKKLNQAVICISSQGYGFITEASNIISKTKNGKQILSIPLNKNIISLPNLILTKPCYYYLNNKNYYCGLISTDGHILTFPISQLPELAKGKGNKLITFSSIKTKVSNSFIFNINDTVILLAGKRTKHIKPPELKTYLSNRTNRGKMLPQGFHNITGVKLIVNKI